jgi:hypothetical protein
MIFPYYSPHVKSLYYQKVLKNDPSNLIAYWPFWEPLGSSIADNLQGIAARDGAYAGVTLGQPGSHDGKTCPLFTTADASRVDVYTTSFRDAFNGQEGTSMLWFKVFNAGVWVDGVQRRLFYFQVDANNLIEVYKRTTNNSLFWQYKAGGISKALTIDNINPTGWTQFMIRWSLSGDMVEVHLNGIQQGATQTGLGTWAGLLNSNVAVYGASNAAPGTGANWHGYMDNAAVWGVAL